MSPSPTPTSYGVLLFPGFEVLDIAGPIECLNMLSRQPLGANLTLAVIGRPDPSSPSQAMAITPAAPNPTLSGHNAFQQSQIYKPTHTFDSAPKLDVLLIPGGFGTRDPFVNCAAELEFIRSVFPGLQHLFTICTGSLLAAAAGVLDGCRATTNKAAWKTVTPFGPRTHWVARARWVDDGKVWTTSGVSAGMDGMVAFLMGVYAGNEEVVRGLVDGMEYVWQEDAAGDPWGEKLGLVDVLPVE